jgi:glycosyltransferase involved in cell wall biosynthesis
MKRVLFVGRTRYAAPLALTHARKFEALGERLDYRVLGSASRAGQMVPRFRLLSPISPRPLDGLLFYLRLPISIASELRSFRPDAVIAQSPYEGLAALIGRRLAKADAKLIVEIHGDWHTATRLYGSQARAVVAPLADRLAAVSVRRADAVRTVSPFTAGLVRDLGVEPAAIFHTYTEIAAFLEHEPTPLPPDRRALFVGVLERYKNVEGLAAAWRLAAPRLPGVVLDLVGNGTQTEIAEQLVADLPAQTTWRQRLAPAEVAAALDAAWCLVLPSFSEGLPRVAIESLARGRPVVGSRAGGIPDAVEDGSNGLLVPPGDAGALAEALVRFFTEEGLAERLAAGARPSAERLLTSPAEYAERVTAMVEQTAANS